MTAAPPIPGYARERHLALITTPRNASVYLRVLTPIVAVASVLLGLFVGREVESWLVGTVIGAPGLVMAALLRAVAVMLDWMAAQAELQQDLTPSPLAASAR